MVQKVQVLLVCDLHDDDVPGAETVAFAVDGGAYEIDLCDEHAEQLRDSFAPFVGAARRVGGRTGGRRGGRGRAAGGPAGDRQRIADIRAWAKSKGLKVSERGRVAASVIEQYDAEH